MKSRRCRKWDRAIWLHVTSTVKEKRTGGSINGNIKTLIEVKMYVRSSTLQKASCSPFVLKRESL